MNLEAEKLHLLQTIINTDDLGLINDITALVNYRKADWFDELNNEQQMDILTGLAEADKGETVTHEDAVKIFGRWGLK